jgi:DtxR family transcriptional regulator, Mn-dependent transcriptional regulator
LTKIHFCATFILGLPNLGVYMREKLTSQSEDYLKAIHVLALEHAEGKVGTQSIADHLNVKAASVTEMLKRLSELGLVEHQAYRGARLTEAGSRIALELIRHHRLLESYLHQALGYALEDVHGEAEKLEHHISETFEARISELLGHPTHDPHGDPIPSLEGKLPEFATRPLLEVAENEEVRLGRISEKDHDFLRLVVSLGLTPGARVKVVRIAKASGTMTLEVAGLSTLEGAGTVQHTLSLEAARKLWVDQASAKNAQ